MARARAKPIGPVGWGRGTDLRWDVVVIGAGAAGLLAAREAARRGRSTLLLEKNRKAGVKILMSGGTRCNLTHATDARGIIAGFGKNGRFLHSALAAFGPSDLVELVNNENVPTKIEETGKIFPASDRALDVRDAFLRLADRAKVQLALGEEVRGISRTGGDFLIETSLREVSAPRVILTTGGQSYPGCGTTGDGYAWAADLGHQIVQPRPALVPLTTSVEWVRELKGVTIPRAALRVIDPARPGKKAELASREGSLLFTHFGLSGPVALDVSGAVSRSSSPGKLEVEVDFSPGEPEAGLDERLRNEASREGNRTISSRLAPGLPKRLIEAILHQAGVPTDCRLAELSRERRGRLARGIKRTSLAITGTLGFEKAEVTTGGVSLLDVDSRDMQSNVAPGLYFAGEILDLDGAIGGYNFQAAFSTGYLAGNNV